MLDRFGTWVDFAAHVGIRSITDFQPKGAHLPFSLFLAGSLCSPPPSLPDGSGGGGGQRHEGRCGEHLHSMGVPFFGSGPQRRWRMAKVGE